MRPFGPLPLTLDGSRPLSRMIRRARGVAATRIDRGLEAVSSLFIALG